MELKSVVIPEDVAAKYTGPDQFRRFNAGMQKILAVPNPAAIREEARRLQAIPRKRGRRPKAYGPGPDVQPHA